MVGSRLMSKVRVRNTFITLPDDQEYRGNGIFKSLSMPTPEDYLNDWYIYNLPSFEDRESWKKLQSHDDEDSCTLDFFLKPALMFRYNKELSNSESPHSNECIPLDDNGKLTSIGSIRHLVGDCKPCAFYKHRTKWCMNGIRCNFCHFDHNDRRRSRIRSFRAAN